MVVGIATFTYNDDENGNVIYQTIPLCTSHGILKLMISFLQTPAMLPCERPPC